MDVTGKPENPLTVPLFVEIPTELKEILGQAADAENIPMNHFVARLLARAVKRPDLAVIPHKRVGRPRKVLAK